MLGTRSYKLERDGKARMNPMGLITVMDISINLY